MTSKSVIFIRSQQEEPMMRIGRMLCIMLIALCSCSSFSNQVRATREGIKIDYEPKEDIFLDSKDTYSAVIYDERFNKAIARDGALGIGLPHVTNLLIGGAMYPLMLALAPDLKMQDNDYQVGSIYKIAVLSRLSKNHIKVSTDNNYDVLVELFLRELSLDFNGPYWNGESSFVVKIRKGDKYLCEGNIQEKAKLFNMWGLGTAQRALNDAFAKSIDAIDFNNCIRQKK